MQYVVNIIKINKTKKAPNMEAFLSYPLLYKAVKKVTI